MSAAAAREDVPDDLPVVLLSGAGGRLGSAFCRQFGSRYQIAALWNRRRPCVPGVGQTLFDPLDPDRPLPINRHPVFDLRADLADQQQITSVVERVLDRFGRIDAVVNSAVDSRWSGLLAEDYSLEDAVSALRVNVAVPLALTATVARRHWIQTPELNAYRNRCVLNISSTASVYVYPGYGQGVYSASKAALNTLTRHLAAEFGSIGVRVNGLAPDSFPGRVPTRAVAEAMSRLIDGPASDEILLQFAGGAEHVLAR